MDVTADAECHSENEAVATGRGGRPRGAGRGWYHCHHGSLWCPFGYGAGRGAIDRGAAAASTSATRSWPVFTKLGCNAGGCHGKASGQNGFRLSLLGFDHDADYAAIVPRVRAAGASSPPPPDQSLLLPQGHGRPRPMAAGGSSNRLRMNTASSVAGSPPARLMASPATRWSTHVSVFFPSSVVLGRQARQQLAAYAPLQRRHRRGRDPSRPVREQTTLKIATVDADGPSADAGAERPSDSDGPLPGSRRQPFGRSWPLGASVPAYEFPGSVRSSTAPRCGNGRRWG